MSYYKTITDLNYRTGPGTNYTKVGVLKKGAVIKVASTKGDWVKFESNKKYYYCSRKYLKPSVEWGLITSGYALPFAKQVVKNKSEHFRGRYTYKGSKINCSVFVSTILQRQGVLPEGVVIYHTSKDHRKKSIGDCVHNRLKVKHYTWHKTDKIYKHLPSTYKRRGCIYVYASSLAIKGDDHCIYGCHSSGRKYTKLSMIKHKKNTYEYTHPILVVGVPEID